MEISTRLLPKATSNPQNSVTKTLHLFLDEYGEPSERCGPDLTRAEPVDQMISRLKRLRAGHPVEFYQACRASGIHLSVLVTREGEERLRMGLPSTPSKSFESIDSKR